MSFYEKNDTTNRTILNYVTDTLVLNPLSDEIPKNVVPTIQPIFDVNRNITKIMRSATSPTTGSTTIYSTPTDKDFYLTGIHLGYTADASADNTSVNMTAFIEDGTSAYTILRLPKTTLTATTENITFTPLYPLKINRGTVIQIQSTFTVGSCTRTGSICGFVDGI
jgi:hypothetical protein